MSELVQKARAFAKYVHRKQTRKYSGRPYFYEHLVSVAARLSELGYREDVVAAAYLHDTIEDQEVTYELLSILFGDDVADIVWMVTDQSKPSDGNRRVRKEIDREHLEKADWRGQAVKLADLIDNSGSIMKNDPDFAKVYMAEKRAILSTALKDPHNAELRRQAELIISSYEEAQLQAALGGVSMGSRPSAEVMELAKIARPLPVTEDEVGSG